MNELEFLRSLEAPLITHLDIAGYRFRMAVNDPALERAVGRYFAPFLAPPAARALRVTGFQGEPQLRPPSLREVPRATGRPKIAYYDRPGLRVIQKTRSGVVHYLRGDHFYAVGDLVRHPQQLFNLVAYALSRALRREGCVALHASAVTRAGAGIAFAGPSGSGKSTLALALMDLGFDYVSNDRIFLRRSGSAVDMTGLPKWPRVNPGTLMASERLRGLMSIDEIARYGRFSRADLWGVEDKYDVPVESVYGRGRLALRTHLDTICVLSWKRRGGRLRIEPLAPAEKGAAVADLLKNEIYDPAGRSAPSPLQLGLILSDVNVFRVIGGIDVHELAYRVVGSESFILADSA